jgi:hypothetical protein
MRYGSYKENILSLIGNFNDVIHHRLVYGRNDAGASKIVSKEYKLFSNGVGATEKNISTGADYTLTPADSSQDGKGGSIPNAQSFIIGAIGIKVWSSNVHATVARTDDSVDTIDVAPRYGASTVPLVDALTHQCTFELWKNASIRLERGVLDEYPCQFGFQGAMGGGQANVPAVTDGGDTPIQAAYALNHTGFLQTNGMMFRPLSVLQVLESLDEFYGVFEPRIDIDLAANEGAPTLFNGHIDFYLVGMLAQEDKARQLVDSYGLESVWTP